MARETASALSSVRTRAALSRTSASRRLSRRRSAAPPGFDAMAAKRCPVVGLSLRPLANSSASLRSAARSVSGVPVIQEQLAWAVHVGQVRRARGGGGSSGFVRACLPFAGDGSAPLAAARGPGPRGPCTSRGHARTKPELPLSTGLAAGVRWTCVASARDAWWGSAFGWRGRAAGRLACGGASRGGGCVREGSGRASGGIRLRTPGRRSRVRRVLMRPRVKRARIRPRRRCTLGKRSRLWRWRMRTRGKRARIRRIRMRMRGRRSRIRRWRMRTRGKQSRIRRIRTRMRGKRSCIRRIRTRTRGETVPHPPDPHAHARETVPHPPDPHAYARETVPHPPDPHAYARETVPHPPEPHPCANDTYTHPEATRPHAEEAGSYDAITQAPSIAGVRVLFGHAPDSYRGRADPGPRAAASGADPSPGKGRHARTKPELPPPLLEDEVPGSHTVRPRQRPLVRDRLGEARTLGVGGRLLSEQ